MPKTGLTALVAVICALSISCGSAGSPGGDNESALLKIGSAEWRGGSEPRVVVDGEWGLGISTPPSCSLVEGRDGGQVSWYEPGGQIELDGRRFSQVFVRNPDAGSRSQLDPEAEYYVRCTSSGDTGKSNEALAPVEGRVPGS
ncbi:hypothetical protein [Rubrobacter aplysinae]|uniref:hypothetical protein n=1 Tax=Rubrobacter aplysinae TaxID=909625 RepID=UPI00064BAD31|nr:hypothetical protein [Rubrobacter aplysinae]